MARITVEDCVKIVNNRFELCLVASNRAKSILSGAATTLDRKEKPAVIALREIAENVLNIDNIKENIVRSIKNRGVADFNQVNPQITEDLAEESESNVAIHDNTFSDENVKVED